MIRAQLIKTDSNFGIAAVDFAKTNELIKEFFAENRHTKLFILQGFIASDSENVTTTLGRGGSDYTGAILAAALDAEVLEIWTDVSGNDDRRPAHCARVSANSAHHIPRSDGAFTLRRKGDLSADDSAGFAEKYSDSD